ncbi:hypothetical protein G4O51_12500 [Candidatus Bathyarchaeota archaeon A05DMB-2]|jgi:hypothetical protein|nr:hypothetical protein [Candidatus Bathyarchaeota archaeon A05DMB-2]
MVVVKRNVIIAEMQDGFSLMTTPQAPRDGTSMMAKQYAGTTVLCTKPSTNDKNTPAQQWQRKFYCDADYLLNNMSPAQKAKWLEYYNQALQSGLTISTAKNSRNTRLNLYATKDISDRAYWFKLALKRKLSEFFTERWSSKWTIESIDFTAEGYRVVARIKSLKEDELLGSDYDNMRNYVMRGG